jgi:peptide/nickel transport system permease protein
MAGLTHVVDITRAVALTGASYRATRVMAFLALARPTIAMRRLRPSEGVLALLFSLATCAGGVFVFSLDPSRGLIGLAFGMWASFVFARGLWAEYTLSRFAEEHAEVAALLLYESDDRTSGSAGSSTDVTRRGGASAVCGSIAIWLGFAVNVVLAAAQRSQLDDAINPAVLVLATPASIGLIVAGLLLKRHALRLGALDVVQARAADPRPPVLYLRSFKDDKMPLKQRFGPLSVILPFLRERVTLEESAVNALWGAGPVIALGRPGERIRPIGAARAYLDDDVWKTQIDTWMAEAGLIACVMGDTEGLRWEYEQIATRKLVHRLLLIVPPIAADALDNAALAFGKHFGADSAEQSLLSNWSNLGPATKRWPTSVRWSGDESPLTFVSRRRDAAAYGLAIRLASGSAATGSLRDVLEELRDVGRSDWLKIVRRPGFIIGAAWLCFLAVALSVGPVLLPDPNEIDQAHWTGTPLAPGVAGHILGTDEDGRDLLARVVKGARTSLTVALNATFLQLAVGSMIGAFGASLLRWRIVRWLSDVLGLYCRVIAVLTLPLALVVLANIASTSNKAIISAETLAVILGFIGSHRSAAIFHDVLVRMDEPAISRARLWRLWHSPPRVGSVVAWSCGAVTAMLLLESTVSFFGFGIQPPNASLGSLLSNASTNLVAAPFIAILPGALLLTTAAAFAFLGFCPRSYTEKKATDNRELR